MSHKPVPGFEKYLAHTDGRIVGPSGKTLKPSIIKGYGKIILCGSPFSKQAFVHRVIAATFLDFDLNRTDLQINHKNGNKSDNRVENLEIVSCSENRWHSHNGHTEKLVDSTTHKTCRKCLKIKPLVEFGIKKNATMGRASYCRICSNEYGQSRRKSGKSHDSIS